MPTRQPTPHCTRPALSAAPVYLALALLGGVLQGCGGSDGDGASAATAQPKPWHLLAVGDMAQCSSAGAAASAAARVVGLAERLRAQLGPVQLLTLGDNVYNVGSEAEFATCYAPTWGRLLADTWPTPGNHDYGTPGASAYFSYFGDRAGPAGRGYYRVDNNGWTVLSLNSNVDASPASAQMAWLKTELRSALPCVAAVWHHPRFTSAPRGDNPTMQAIWAELQAAKVDLVMQGHEHHYERFAPLTADGEANATGIPAWVVGSGGASLSDFNGQRVGSQSQVKAHGVMHLALKPGGADWRFVDTDDKVRDAGAISCR
jgi:acid phosphatase type 7